ncbi:hypothetical protein CfE428DRAFT_5458 [Chthoniobacter flavus Ellin428]|uniref:Uncharacterized protein n=1 Tax=Chthoniobacter flavus Ellin428 TaxID=497964 RepID=B4D968_9BACT|nr:hypothetical protein CfE428DRAFT_5458 [Chthoniobacter flavus Ellin428]
MVFVPVVVTLPLVTVSVLVIVRLPPVVKVSELIVLLSAGPPVVVEPVTMKSAKKGVPTGAAFWIVDPPPA